MQFALTDLEASTNEDEFEDDEIKVEHCRAQRYLHENYLDSIRITYVYYFNLHKNM